MFASVVRRIAVALITGGVALGGSSLVSASAEIRPNGHGGGLHGGGMHRGGGWRGHYAGGYGRHYAGNGYGGYYGGYGGYGYYGGPGCLPFLGIITGNYCYY